MDDEPGDRDYCVPGFLCLIGFFDHDGEIARPEGKLVAFGKSLNVDLLLYVCNHIRDNV